MERLIFPYLILLGAAMASVTGDSEVKEIISHYSCCNPEIKFDRQREVTCEVNGTNFAHAYANGPYDECEPPCKKLEDGLMLLDECVDVNVVLRTVKGNVVEKEERIHFRCHPCPGSAKARGNQESGGLLALAVVIGGFSVKLISRRA